MKADNKKTLISILVVFLIESIVIFGAPSLLLYDYFSSNSNTLDYIESISFKEDYGTISSFGFYSKSRLETFYYLKIEDLHNQNVKTEPNFKYFVIVSLDATSTWKDLDPSEGMIISFAYLDQYIVQISVSGEEVLSLKNGKEAFIQYFSRT